MFPVLLKCAAWVEIPGRAWDIAATPGGILGTVVPPLHRGGRCHVQASRTLAPPWGLGACSTCFQRLGGAVIH